MQSIKGIPMVTFNRKKIKPFKVMFIVIALLWFFYIVSFAIPSIYNFGIHPRTLRGIVGIIVSPFLHGTSAHLITNSFALFVLGVLFLSVESARASYIIIPIFLLSGCGTWVIGRSDTVHIGASGIIYGIFGYLLFIGIFRKKITLILLATLLLMFYGGMLWGIFPLFGNHPISWEGHLSGFVSGILVAWAEANRT
ncbi:MAG: rhomboid family intramembrane serine protease [Spirochaetes bacterium]|nr:rhomboid family intramembrane serine protease [Spirochaetota bacterium]